MKALVTGGGGFIGANLALSLESSGWEVKVLDDFSSGSSTNLQDFHQEIVRCDIRQIASRFQFWIPDVIFHQAAITDTTITDENRMRLVNVLGFESVLKYAAQTGSRIVYASSAAVYGNGPAPMRESQELEPLNSYARSKVESEQIGLRYHQKYGFPLVGLRYFNVYGRGENHKGHASSMIWQLMKQIESRGHPRLFKWGEQSRDQIYVKDIVNANLLAARCPVSGIYNVGTGEEVSFNRILGILSQCLEIETIPDYFDNPYRSYQHKTQADTTQSRQILGFRAQYDLEAGIADYLESESKFDPLLQTQVAR